MLLFFKKKDKTRDIGKHSFSSIYYVLIHNPYHYQIVYIKIDVYTYLVI